VYWRHFNLTAEPFSLTPDPSFLYLSPVHAEAYAALMMGLRERRGLTTMIGEVGTGKTTLVYSVLSGLGPEIHTAYVSNARLSFDGILRVALRDFGVPCDSAHSTELTDAFNAFLLDCANKGTTAALVIDEAQNLSPETFEDLRLLTNFETYTHKLLQIVLVGQPELDTKLRDPALRQVAERIAVRCLVNPLSRREARAYLEHRLAAVNGSIDIFTRPALQLLVARSRGIPRSLNILAHNAMLFAYGEATERVSRRFVAAAVREKEGRGLVRLWRRSPRTREAARGDTKRFRSSIWTLSAAAVCGVVVGLAVASGENLFGRLATPPATATAPDTASEPYRATAEDPLRGAPANAETEIGATDVQPPAPDVVPALAALPEPAAVVDVPSSAPVEPAPAEAETAPAKVETLPTEPALPQPAAHHAPAVEPQPEPAIVASPPAAPAEAREPGPQIPAEQTSAPVQPVASAPADAAAPEPAPVPVPTPPAAELVPQPRPAEVATAPSPSSPRPTPAPRAPAAAARQSTPTARPTATAAARPTPTPAPIQPRTEPQSPATPQNAARVITVPPGSSLSGLLLTVYGQYSSEMVDRVKAVNPQVNDPDFIIAGDRLRFPDATQGQGAQPAGGQGR
jgi:type II secretory pathway predicted ATPase ExeA